MDGTLTVPMHDFDAMKQRLGIPPEISLLEGALQKPEPERSDALEAIRQWEQEIAEQAIPSEDAIQLLAALHTQGKELAILTRNRKDLALITLQSAGLRKYFTDTVILGRDCAPPKPAPDGVLSILSQWNAPQEEAVMIGDYLYDIEAGIQAGIDTIQIIRNPDDPIHPQATIVLHDLRDLLADNNE